MTGKDITEFLKAISLVTRYGSDIVLRDSLTGLYNRQFFREVSEKEIARAKRYNRPLTLVFFDVDGLKKINDTYGHQEGDRILKKVGQVILENCRKSDLPVRWGGDEFLMLLPETDVEEAKNLVERILADAKDIHLSYGLTAWKDSFSSLEDFVTAADQNMYKKKRGM